MRPIEVKVLSAAMDERQARVKLDSLCEAAPNVLSPKAQWRPLYDKWLATRDALRAAQDEYVHEIDHLRVLAPGTVAS
jgi:hypothetical protein